jgi:hypothetical protein
MSDVIMFEPDVLQKAIEATKRLHNFTDEEVEFECGNLLELDAKAKSMTAHGYDPVVYADLAFEKMGVMDREKLYASDYKIHVMVLNKLN